MSRKASKLRAEADMCLGEGRVLQAALIRAAADEIDRLKAALAEAERERDVAIGVIERIGAEIADYAGRESSTTDRERGRA